MGEGVFKEANFFDAKLAEAYFREATLKEAKYWREFILDKLNLLVNWVKEMIQSYGERRRKNSEDKTSWLTGRS